MNNHIITQQQAQDIFTKICEKNQWQILESTFRGDFEYYLEPLELSEKDQKKHEEYKVVSPQKFSQKINFFENKSSIYFRISHEETFRILSGFLEMSNLNTVKSLNYFARNNDHTFKKWESMLELLQHERGLLPLDDVANVISKYSAKISIKNYSSMVAGDLPDLFKLLNKCKEQDSTYNFHPALSSFCANHLDQILDKVNIKTFIFSKLKEFVPNSINYYKEFLQIEDSKKDFFSEIQPQYKTFHLDKKTLFEAYSLNLSSPTNTDNYYTLLENATVFLNKDKMLKKLNCHHIELTGKQQKYDNFILTINTKENFNLKLLKTFFTALLEEAVTVSNSIESCHSSSLKESLKPKYDIIFNHAKMDMELPHKVSSLPKANKL